jgi:hypothetical protein
MIDDNIRQLESPDPTERRTAILAVGKAGDPRALPFLLKIYKNDPDPVLRELALRAGRHIRDTQTQTAQSPAVPPPVTQPVSQPVRPSPAPLSPVPLSQVTPAPTSPVTELSPLTPAPLAPVRKLPTEREKALAKGRLDLAIGQKLQGQNGKATESLAEAVRYDPDLAVDTVALNLAANLTGISDVKQAMAEIVKRAEAQRAQGGRIAGPKKLLGPAEASPMTDTLLEILVFFVIVLVLSLITTVVLSRQSDEIIQTLATQGRYLQTNPFRGQGSLFVVLVAFVSAIGATIITLLSDTVFYMVGMALGGVGDWFRVVGAVMRVQIVCAIISIGLALLSLWLTSTAGSAPADLEESQKIWDWLSLINIPVGLVALIPMAQCVGRAHEIGFLKGLVTMIGGSIVQCCACFAISWCAVTNLLSR